MGTTLQFQYTRTGFQGKTEGSLQGLLYLGSTYIHIT